MPLASSRVASELRAKALQEEKALQERRERLSLPRHSRSSTRVTKDSVKRRRQAREASEERTKKQIKAPADEAINDECNEDPDTTKENMDSELASLGTGRDEPEDKHSTILSPTPYWKVASERRGSKKFSPPLTRSTKKKKQGLEHTAEAEMGGTALMFSPPDQAQNAAREKEELEEKLRRRQRRVSNAVEEGRYLEFSPNSFQCRNRNFDISGRKDPSPTNKPPIGNIKQGKEGFEEESFEIQDSDAGRSHVSELTPSNQSNQQNSEEVLKEIKGVKEKLDALVNDRRNSDAGLLLQHTLHQERDALEAERAKATNLEREKARLEASVSFLESTVATNQELFEAEKSRLKADMEACKSQFSLDVERLEHDIETLQKEKLELLKQVNALEVELKQLKAYLSTNAADSKLIEQQNDQIQKLEDAQQAHLKTKEELSNMFTIRSELEAQILRIEDELTSYKQDAATSESQLKKTILRLQEIESESHKELQARDTTISDLMDRVNALREEKEESDGEIGRMSEEITKLQNNKAAQNKQISDLQEALAIAQQKHKATCDSFLSQKDSVEASLAKLKDALEASTTNLRIAQENESAKAKEAQQKSISIMELEKTLAEYKGRLEHANHRLSTVDEREDELLRKLIKSDQIRAELHSRVIQLSGNIRVFVRVRPTIPGEEENLKATDQNKSKNRRKTKVPVSSESPFSFPGQLEVSSASNANDDITKRVIEITEPAKDRGGLSERKKVWRFPFDNVYSPSSGQDEIWEGVAPLVQCAIDGFPVCIFAYGQTGSGKTHTMLGEPGNEGIISRAVNKMFAAKQELEEYSRGGTEVDMSVELLEIYNEQVRDLLVPNAGPDGREVSLKVTSNEVVGNLRVPAGSQQEVMKILALAQSRRCVKATQSNAESSRSHMVFTLHFEVAMKNGIKRFGRLNICDLAGSERLSKSGANSVVHGDLMKETKCINSSLSVLSNVIEKLQAGCSSIPYRESKLTFLLQNSLGGNSKTLAIVCCNPHPAHFHESLCSIRFAEKVSKVELKAMANFTC